MKCFCHRDTQTVLVMIITGTNCGIHCRLVLRWCGALTDLVDPYCMELLIIAEIWRRQLLIYVDPVCKHHAVNMTGCHKGTYLISAFCGDKWFHTAPFVVLPYVQVWMTLKMFCVWSWSKFSRAVLNPSYPAHFPMPYVLRYVCNYQNLHIHFHHSSPISSVYIWLKSIYIVGCGVECGDILECCPRV